jgi:hypothetical protein
VSDFPRTGAKKIFPTGGGRLAMAAKPVHGPRRTNPPPHNTTQSRGFADRDRWWPYPVPPAKGKALVPPVWFLVLAAGCLLAAPMVVILALVRRARRRSGSKMTDEEGERVGRRLRDWS